MKLLFAIRDFNTLSLRLNLFLSVTPIDWRAVLSCMFDKQMTADVEDHLLETLYYLEDAYGGKKRKVGTPAILHPIRSAAILAGAHNTINTLDILTALLHDKDEDILSDGYSLVKWNILEENFRKLADKIECREKWFLNERIHFLARKKEESYHKYLSGLIRQAQVTPELIRVKLADRLDNTLDLRLDFHDRTEKVNFYHLIFSLLFDSTYEGLNIHGRHPSTHKIRGSKRLHELFKNFTLFSLLISGDANLDEPSQRLLKLIADASIREARNVLLHIFAYHLRSLEVQRSVVRNCLDFIVAGDINGDNQALEVFIKRTFDHEDGSARKQSLDDLYADKERMVRTAIAFVVLFGSYLENWDGLFSSTGHRSNIII